MFRIGIVVVMLGACGDDAGRRPTADAAAGANPYPGLYVTNQNGAITVFDLAATGDAAPLRTITGATTGLSLPIGIAVDSQGDVYVADRMAAHVAVFAPGATGDVAPIRMLTDATAWSPETIAMAPGDDLYVATCPSCGASAGGAVGLYHFPAGSATSDASIAGADTQLTVPAVALDTDGTIVAPNAFGGVVATFAAGATGDATPTSTFTPAGNQNTQGSLAIDDYILLSSPSDGIDIYAASTTGAGAAPVANLPSSTMLPISYPGGISIDLSATPPVLYLADYGASAVYAIEVSGTLPNLTVQTVRTISGSATLLDGPLDMIAIH